MPATSKAELLEISQKEYTKLSKLIDSVPPDRATVKVDGVSIKDVIGHRAYWITLFLGWYHDGVAGRPVHIPAKGYKWNQLNEFNAKLREMQADLNWDDARKLLSDAYADFMSFVDGLDDKALYSEPMVGGNGKWTTGRWAEATGPSHFRSAAKFIRKALKSV
ncbi:hypothetical protein SAMN04488515_3370 [Cognatiyoonia koreensis]|uniref:ClbS/DfsB family four-helix bundle protein n=1 Tax=Cognatiyoonia koreensis TaxID=364200 RepID=A0A1I0RW66_9RHOB|nr:ClbS/DfsB family four-helix bundle protein [Cognatiyoonia koreensis]SEW45696.1 hypothetical protein SAMN04488515_3370 [Cognatiyoonia koreensis]